MTSQDGAGFSQNEARSGSKIGAELTRPISPDVPLSFTCRPALAWPYILLTQRSLAGHGVEV